MKRRTLVTVIILFSLFLAAMPAHAAAIPREAVPDVTASVQTPATFNNRLADIVNTLPEVHHDGFEGVQNQFFCRADGWAMDPDEPSLDLNVRIFSDGAQVAQTSGVRVRLEGGVEHVVGTTYGDLNPAVTDVDINKVAIAVVGRRVGDCTLIENVDHGRIVRNQGRILRAQERINLSLRQPNRAGQELAGVSRCLKKSNHQGRLLEGTALSIDKRSKGALMDTPLRIEIDVRVDPLVYQVDVVFQCSGKLRDRVRPRHRR